MPQEILILNNFATQEDCNSVINFIDSNIDIFNTGPKKLLFTLPFGKDKYHEDSKTNLDSLEAIHKLVLKYFQLVIDQTKLMYKDESDLFVNSFWLAKQKAGGRIEMHGDNDAGKNKQFKYSCAIYLKTVTLDGNLFFPKLDYFYQPVAGDLVMWPSQDPIYDHVVGKISEDRYSMLFWLTDEPEFDLLNQ